MLGKEVITVIRPLPSLHFPQHTQEDFQARFKGRPELEGLLAQMKQ